MDNNFSSDPERVERHVPERKEGRKKEHEAEEVKETSKEVGEGLSEIVEGAEIAEAGVEGEVSEAAGEGKKKVSGGTLPKGGKAQSFAAKKLAPPGVDVMRAQIAVQIKKEIVLLEREASRIMGTPGQFSPFKLNGVVSKIRELKEILANLAYATADAIKGWWMKFVKGITI